MTRTMLVVSVGMIVLSCGPRSGPAPAVSAGHQAGEEAAVLAAMDRYVNAISASDLSTMAATQTPDGMTYTASAMGGPGKVIAGRPNAF